MSTGTSREIAQICQDRAEREGHFTRGRVPKPKAASNFRTKSNLRALRISRGLNQLQFCAIAGFHMRTLQKLENGEIFNTTIMAIFQAANALDLGVTDLFPLFGPRIEAGAHAKKPKKRFQDPIATLES